MPVANADLLKVINTLNKKLGPGTVIAASEAKLPARITTGSLTMDMVLGGGWPMNHWVELVGEASHGKTAIALKTVAANQATNPEFTAIWIAAEGFDVDYARMCGVDTDRLILVETSIMEEAYDAALQFAESKAVDLIVLDSLPALTPMAEDEKSMDEATVGRGALLTNKFFRKMTHATKRSLIEYERPLLGIIINQYRMKIGVMHGDPRTTPGGQGKDYAFSIRCEVKRDEWIDVGTGENKRRVGQTIRLRTIKNKTYPPQQTAYLDFYFSDGGPIDKGQYDRGKEIVALGILNDVIERRGGWMYYKDRKWQGAQALIDSLREEPDLSDEISKLVLDSIRLNPIIEVVSEEDDAEE